MRSVLEWPTGVTVYNPEKCYNGYTIYAPASSPIIYMIDMLGRVVHMWYVDVVDDEDRGITLGLAAQGKYLENGHLLVGKMGFGLKELDWNGRAVWEFHAPNMHHDYNRLANGNTLLLCYEEVENPDLSDKPLQDDYFVEVSPAGETIWKWYANEHFEEFELSGEAREFVREHGGDYLHCNSCSVLPNGNILTSFRNTNLIAVIDKTTGKIVWKWGPGELVGPHMPSMLENGNILIYDNGGEGGYPPVSRFYTRLVELNMKTKEIVWEYVNQRHKYWGGARFLSLSWGGAQRLPNGNTLSLDSNAGRLFEITYDGEIVWEYVNPFMGQFPFEGEMRMETGVYRCYRIAYDAAPQVSLAFTEPTTPAALAKGREPICPLPWKDRRKRYLPWADRKRWEYQIGQKKQ